MLWRSTNRASASAVTSGGAARALELLGKTVGMFTDRVETKVEVVDPEQLKADLERHLMEHAH